jgi:hypothetical protein
MAMVPSIHHGFVWPSIGGLRPSDEGGRSPVCSTEEEPKAVLRGFDSWYYGPQASIGRPGMTGCHSFDSRLAMEGHSETTIATLLRHSNNALVRRYPHPRPGPSEVRCGNGRLLRQIGETFPRQVSIGTVTGTGNKAGGSVLPTAEVPENTGAPDTN